MTTTPGHEAPANATAGASPRADTSPTVTAGDPDSGQVLVEILAELRAITARLDRAETAASHAAKLFGDHVAPLFAKLAANPKLARFLK